MMANQTKTKVRRPFLCSMAFFALLMAVGCASTAPSPSITVSIESNPAGALATLIPNDPGDHSRTVLGITPTTAEIPSSTTQNHRIVIEHRGYAAYGVPAGSAGNQVVATLEATGGSTGIDPALANPRRIALCEPDIEVIRRGFSSEEVSDDDSAVVADSIVAAVRAYLGPGVDVALVESSRVPPAFARGAEAAARTIDPIRLPFLAEPPTLETAASRRAAADIGRLTDARAILFVSGRSSIETSGMAAGKVGLMVAGTAASYGAGYGQALSSGHSSFTYNIYIPQSTGGTRIDAVLVDASTGEVVWINRGLYGPLRPGDDKQANATTDDVLTGIPAGRASIEDTTTPHGGDQ
jgi:hypothetical protein